MTEKICDFVGHGGCRPNSTNIILSYLIIYSINLNDCKIKCINDEKCTGIEYINFSTNTNDFSENRCQLQDFNIYNSSSKSSETNLSNCYKCNFKNEYNSTTKSIETSSLTTITQTREKSTTSTTKTSSKSVVSTYSRKNFTNSTKGKLPTTDTFFPVNTSTTTLSTSKSSFTTYTSSSNILTTTSTFSITSTLSSSSVYTLSSTFTSSSTLTTLTKSSFTLTTSTLTKSYTTSSTTITTSSYTHTHTLSSYTSSTKNRKLTMGNYTSQIFTNFTKEKTPTSTTFSRKMTTLTTQTSFTTQINEDCPISLPPINVKNIGPFQGTPGEDITFDSISLNSSNIPQRKRRLLEKNNSVYVACAFLYNNNIFNLQCVNNNTCKIPKNAPSEYFTLIFCDCKSFNSSENEEHVKNCISKLHPRIEYGISYFNTSEYVIENYENITQLFEDLNLLSLTSSIQSTLSSDDMRVVAWLYISIIIVIMIVVSLLILPKWKKLMRGKNQWNNVFMYCAKLCVLIYLLADPTQGKIFSSTAFAGIISNVYEIMEGWWEFRREPGNLFLTINRDEDLSEWQLQTKEKMKKITDKLGIISYFILLLSIIGLAISQEADGKCSILNKDLNEENECAYTAGEIWFIWIGLLCSVAESYIEDDIYKIEVSMLIREIENSEGGEHIDYDKDIIKFRTFLNKIKQYLYVGSLFLVSLLGSIINIEIHEIGSNIILLIVTGFSRWIKMQVTKKLTNKLRVSKIKTPRRMISRV